MLRPVGISLELHDIRSCHLSLVGWTIDRYFLAPEVDRRFDWWERGCILSPTPNVICVLPFLFLPWTCFNMSQLMSVIPIERSETRAETSSYDIPVAKHVAISCTPDYVLCVWCFNEDISYSQYFWSCTRSSLNIEFHMELPFDSCYIADYWEMIVSPSKSLGFMVSESKNPPYRYTHIGFLNLTHTNV